MVSGPTQNYDDATLGRWKPRPALAVGVRVTLVAFPPLVAIVFGLAAVRWVPAQRLSIDPWVWLAAEIALATALLLVMTRLTRRLLPLSALLRLTLYFPDRAPSRFAVAVRRYSPDVLREHVEGVLRRDEPLDQEYHHAAFLLDLVAAISEHDHSTRGHSERVQAYSALIGTELGLSARDAAKLSWAALLHDVGKLRTPPAILNEAGRPSEGEWEILCAHPSAGMAIAAPLAAWLGPWLDVVGQHHERWDGGGYPLGLAGSAISRGARIVAVADAFDAITSTRSYKKPMSAAAARAELARCSGQQFDPEVVRAFLAVGLGRLQVIAGPASVLSGLPGLGSMPLPNLATVASGATTAATTAAATVVASVIGAVLAVAAPASATDNAPAATGPAASSYVAAPALRTAPDRAAYPAVGPAATSTPAPEPSPTPSATALPSLEPAAARPSSGTVPASSAAPSAAQAAAPSAVPSAARVPVPVPVPVPAPAPAPAPAPVPGQAAAPPVPASPASACTQAGFGGTALPGADLQKCDLSGRTLTGDYSGANLAGADLTGATLTDLDLSGAKLSGANLDRATISSTSFDDARLTGASFAGATISGSTFLRASLNPTTLRDARLTSCTF